MTESKLETAGLLRQAAAVMEKGGICRGRLFDEQGAHCALGAIEDVNHGLGAWAADTALAGMLDEIIPVEGVWDTYNKYHARSSSYSLAKIAAWSNMLCKDEHAVACVMRATATYLEWQHEQEAPSETNK